MSIMATVISSIGNGGFNTKCAKTTTRKKMCRNHHQEKTGKNRFEPEKSQGQMGK